MSLRALLLLSFWAFSPTIAEAHEAMVPLMPISGESLPGIQTKREPHRQRLAKAAPRQLVWRTSAPTRPRLPADDDDEIDERRSAGLHASSGSDTSWGWGFELGTMAQPANANADLLGLQFFYGARAFVRYPLTETLYVKPSIGFFHRSASEGAVSVAQNMVEGGASLLYAPWPRHRQIWLFGLAQRVDMLFSQITALGNSATTPFGFQYRLGPAMGYSWFLSPSMNLTVDIDLTVPVVVPVRPLGSLSIGIMFK